MGKLKVLILQNELSGYNVEVYNILSKQYDLTVGFYQNDKSVIDCFFQKRRFRYKKIGPFFIIPGLRQFARSFDVVTSLADLHVLSYISLLFGKRTYKIISWGIGFRCSYIHPYDVHRKHGLVDKINEIIGNRYDANIFYMENAKEFWRGTGFKLDKVFIAPNTTGVVPIELNPEKKNNILFVGTLYRGKGLDLLFKSFSKVVDKQRTDTKLVIVGNGEMREELELLAKEKGISDNVVFTGGIYNEEELSHQFENALLCVSPTQGGLTCPKSMGYGVPFVCRKDAITGGEIYHITDGVNGIMYDKDDDLIDILSDAIKNPNRYIEMGICAKKYYDNNATPWHMAQGAVKAIEYVTKNSNNKKNV